SERMLRHFGADIEANGRVVAIRGGRELSGQAIAVPGDISSAAFFMVAGLIVPGSEILIKGVGINPTRTGILDILKMMGGDISLLNSREISPPIIFRMSRIPVLVGLIPTPLIRISEPGTISPATMKNAAEEMSPGTAIAWPLSSLPPLIATT